MQFRRFWSTLLAALLLVSAIGLARAQEPAIRAIYISGNEYPGAYGDLAGDYATLQVRPVLEALGYSQIAWSPADGSTTIYGLPESPVVLRPGDPVLRLKGRSVVLPIAPYVKGGRLHAPLEFFRQAVGARVEWVTATREVEITPPPYNQVGAFGPAGAGPATFAAIGRDGEGRLYLAVAGGPRQGVWLSLDQGATWEAVGDGLPADLKGAPAAGAPAGGPGARRGLAGARFITGPGTAVYLLLDGDLWALDPDRTTWTRVDGLPAGRVVDAAIQANGDLWAAVDTVPDDGRDLAYDLYRLDRGGGAWVKADLDLPVLRLAADAAGRLWAAGKGGAAVLSGGSWTHLGWEAPSWVYQIVPSPDDPQWVWAITHRDIRVSQDGGQTWQASPSIKADPAALAAYRLVPGVGQEVFLLMGEQGVRYSPTGGGQWFRLTGYWPDARVLDAVVDEDGRLFLATTSGGVIIPRRIPQPGALRLPRLAPHPEAWGPNLAEGAKGAGGLWLDPQQADTAYALLAREDGTRLWRTADGGKSWQPVALPFDSQNSPRAFFHHPTRSGYYGVQGPDGIHITKDGGKSWSHLDASLHYGYPLAHLTLLESGRLLGVISNRAGSSLVYTDDLQGITRAVGAPAWHITSLVANPAAPGRLYACDHHHEQPCRFSTDGGTTWQPLPAQPPRESGPPIRLIWSPAAPDELIAGRFVSRDGGQSWEPLPFFQEGERVLQIAIHPSDRTVRAAAVEIGGGTHQVWLSRDGGETWTALGRPPGATWVHQVQFDAVGHLWVGADAGIWRLTEF